ncbi:MAG: hypothetical protein ACRDL7_05920 [Gaiellaceae bacterium]
MVLVAVKDRRVQTSELTDFHYRKLLIWAFVNGQAKGGFARNVLVARTTSPENESEQTKGMSHYSTLYKIPEDELEALITHADQNGVSLVELHNRLEKGFRGEEAVKRSSRRQGKKSNLAKPGEENE